MSLGIISAVDSIEAKESKKKMPIIFIGHGSPMNALAENSFTKSLNNLGTSLGKPKAILVVSAHWLTNGVTGVQSSLNPEVIYDFGGFPQELYQVKYPVKGYPELAHAISQKIKLNPTIATEQWGIDHGTWTVLRHIFPKADIPTFQLSIDFSKDSNFHFQLGKELAYLREQGVLILGSGNVIHNLRTIDGRNKTNLPSTPWAKELSETIKSALLSNDTKKLIEYTKLPGANLGIANPDHYYPFLYMLGSAQGTTQMKQVYEGFDLGTLDMRCVLWS